VHYAILYDLIPWEQPFIVSLAAVESTDVFLRIAFAIDQTTKFTSTTIMDTTDVVIIGGGGESCSGSSPHHTNS
jgi:hypothetical protein